MPRILTDITGNRYGRLTVIEGPFRNGKKDTFWRCLCDCGKEVTCMKGVLTAGTTRSCGCLKIEARAKQVIRRNVKPVIDDGRTEFRFVHRRSGSRDQAFSLWMFDEAEARRVAVIGTPAGEVEFVGIRQA